MRLMAVWGVVTVSIHNKQCAIIAKHWLWFGIVQYDLSKINTGLVLIWLVNCWNWRENPSKFPQFSVARMDFDKQ